MADWGFTAVRLGAMWTGFEGEQEGLFNETYVEILQEIVESLANHGIYTYLDMHQDVLTGVDGYWGIPPWLYAKMAPPAHPYPWPMKSKAGYTTWACGYFSQEISNNFEQLYTEHKQEFANVWKEIAKRFKGNPNILGYELLNEPWSGDIYRDTSLLLPGNAGFLHLQPFFEAASAAIREVDDETIIFWEPVTYGYYVNAAPNLILDSVLDLFLKSHNFTEFLPILEQVCGPMEVSGVLAIQELAQDLVSKWGEANVHRFNSVTLETERPSILGPGFTAPPGGPEYLNRTAMSWHYYCWALGAAGSGPYDPTLRTVCDELLGPMVFNTVDARAKELGGSATMLTEFGECYPSFDHPEEAGSIECNFVLGKADEHFQSWSYWDTAGGGVLWDAEGEPVLDNVRVFSRPHPQATAGRPVSLQYSPDSRVLDYQFMPDPSIGAPTILYVPPLIFSNGYSLEVSPNLTWEVDETQPSLLLITATDSDLAHIVLRPEE